MMKTTKLFFRITTLFLFLLFGIAIGAKSAGLDTFSFLASLMVLGLLGALHIRMMRKRFARLHPAPID